MRKSSSRQPARSAATSTSPSPRKNSERLSGESLGIRQRLAESNPASAALQRDLSYSYTIIAQSLMRQARWSDALPLLEQSLAIDERLAALAPTNVTFQNDVRVSRNLVAAVRDKLVQS